MPSDDLRQLAQLLLAGQCDLEQFVALAAAGPAHAVSAPDAMVDVDRARRCGFPEVIFGEGKSPETIAAIAQQLLDRGQSVLVTHQRAEGDRSGDHAAEPPIQRTGTNHPVRFATL